MHVTVENSLHLRPKSISFKVSPSNVVLSFFLDLKKNLSHDQIVKIQQTVKSLVNEPTFSPLLTKLALLPVYVEWISEQSRFCSRNLLQKESKIDQSIVRCPDVYFLRSFFFFFSFCFFFFVDFLFFASFTFECFFFAYINFLDLSLINLSIFEDILLFIFCFYLS